MNKFSRMATLAVGIFGLSLVSTALAASAEITGTWNFTVQRPNKADEHPVFVLKQEGAKLTGTYTGRLGEAPVTGTLTGDDVTFTVPAKNAQGDLLELVFTGTILSPSQMKGTMNMARKFTVEWSAARK